jgi:hypothetical protein
VKAFEKAPHRHVAGAAKKHGYNQWIARLSLASYRLPRSIGVDSVYSRTIVAPAASRQDLALLPLS